MRRASARRTCQEPEAAYTSRYDAGPTWESLFMFASAGAGVLAAEFVGLLLEGLGLDDTLGGSDSMALARELAALRMGPGEAGASVRRVLQDGLDHALATVEAAEHFAKHAQGRGLTVDASHLEAVRRILRLDGSLNAVKGLQGVPTAVQDLALHEFELAHRRVKPLCKQVHDAWDAVRRDIVPSAMTELDLAKEIRALRDGGWLFGLIRTTSDSARDRVAPHMATDQRGKSAEAMAGILERALEYKTARTRLEGQVAEAHSWVDWAVNVDAGRLAKERTTSLRWMLANSEAGAIGPLERDMLTDAAWRIALSQPAGERLAAALRWQPAPSASPAEGVMLADALRRVERWLAEPPSSAAGDFAEFARVLTPALPDVVAALLVAQEAQDSPALSQRVTSAVALSQGPFGPADTNRSRFRAIMEQSRDEVAVARALLDPLRPQHPHLARLLGEIREFLGAMANDLNGQAPVRGPLRVAIAGRTKAGKTTLRKVLTRDVTEGGIGRGAHRTTRTADDFAWDRITFVDTPGVSAKDDEYDADLAAQTCRDADAVVWVYAESIHDEEGLILQSLLAIKPLLVLYNAKWKVDDVRRLALFARRPALAFRDEHSHAERTRQMAEAAGVRQPLFLAAHVSAARRALIAGEECGPAWEASRIPDLEAELRLVLASRSQGLRSLRLADQVRTPLVVAAGRAAEAADLHAARCEAFRHRLASEERDLRDAVTRSVTKAQLRSQKNFAALAAQLPAWLAKVDGRQESLDEEWSRFLGRLELDALLADITATLAADARTYGLLLDREDRLEERLQQKRLQAAARKTRSRLAMAWRIVKRFIGLATRLAPRLVGEAALGPAGWIAAAADVVMTTGKAATDEIRASSIDRHAWEQDAGIAARYELERVRRRVTKELDLVSAALLHSASEHFRQARSDVAVIASTLRALTDFEQRTQQRVGQIDRLTVERLLQLGDVTACTVISVDRVPNLHLRAKVVGDPRDAARCLEKIFDGCLSETITVTRANRKDRRRKGNAA